ncbi:MAG: hypothetical protein HQL75_02755 [Magnetococcales bacterium]|nr:hypothetical protein [Magnetococcales bacterium]
MEASVRSLLISILDKGSHVIRDDAEYKTLRDYADTGLVAFGFHFKNRQSEAKLTSLGRRYVEFIVKPEARRESGLAVENGV